MNRGKLDVTLAAMFSNIKYSKDYLFYAHMIGQCSIKIDENMPSPAGVAFSIDHYNLYINPTMFDEFSLVERLAILKHEMLHILYDHVGRKEDRVHLPWNYSSDCALNQDINPEHLPDCAITPKTLGEMLELYVKPNESSEFYYDLIKEKAEEMQQNEDGEGQGEGDSSDGKSSGKPRLLDNHDKWEESQGDKDLQQDITKKMVEKSQEETIKGKGNLPHQTGDWLDMHSRKNEVSWKKVLRGIVGNKRVGKRSTIMRQDRRMPNRPELRGKLKDRVFDLLVVGDVSGSMCDEAVITTLGEVRHICDITKTAVNLIQVDTEAYAPEKLDKKTKIIERKACGGTYLYPAIEMANKHNLEYNAIVVLTDGGLFNSDIEKFKSLNKKVIWLIEPSGYVMDEMNQGKMQAIKLKEV